MLDFALNMGMVALLAYIPFLDSLKRRFGMIILEVMFASVCFSVFHTILLMNTGFDASGNIMLLMLLPFFFLYYIKTVNNSSHKLLFVLAAAIHAGSVLGGIEVIIFVSQGVSVMQILESGIWQIPLLMIFIRVVFYTAMVVAATTLFTPRLREFNSQNMKGLFLFPLMFACIVAYIHFYFFQGGITDAMFTFTFIPLIYLSFAIYWLLFRMLENITENARLEADSRAQERLDHLKSEMMRTVSHELRTPLAVIKGFAEFAAEEGERQGAEADHINNLNVIAQEAQRLADMTEDMRRITLARDYHVSRHRVDVAALIANVGGLYAKFLARKNIGLVMDVPEDTTFFVLGNEDELTQVIFNLLRNADLHTMNGRIILKVADCPQAGFVCISVSDTGCGIPAERLPGIFGRGVSYREGGQGYGLFICREIIEAHGGEIMIDSAVGRGCTVSFHLPLEDKPE